LIVIIAIINDINLNVIMIITIISFQPQCYDMHLQYDKHI